MVIVEVGPVSGLFSNGPLLMGSERFEKVHHALRQLAATPGEIVELLGRIFKGQPSLLQGLLVFPGAAVWAGHLPVAPQTHPPPSSTLL